MYNFFPLSVVFKLHKSHQLVMLLEFKEGVTWRRKRRTGGCPSPGGWRSSSLGWTGAGDTASPTSRKSLLTTSQFCSNYSTSSCHLARECTLHRLQPAKSPAYSLCRTGQVDTLLHAVFNCEANNRAAAAMLRCAQLYSPSLSADGLLRLELEVEDPFTLPTVAIIATGVDLIWTNRMKTTTTSEAAMWAELQARAGLLKQTRSRRLREAGAIMAILFQTRFFIAFLA